MNPRQDFSLVLNVGLNGENSKERFIYHVRLIYHTKYISKRTLGEL